MARDRASIRVDMWGDDDWRGLTMPAQHLYMMLLSHATLNYAGVADWRPGRLASLVRGGSVDGVKIAAMELQVARFVLVDEVTEEVLVRSFLKHDGLMKQPRLAVSMAKAFAGIASEKIRSVVSFELQKLRGAAPELSAWELKQVRTVLAAKGSPIEDFTQRLTPEVTPTFGPNLGEGFDEHTSTSTSTSTSTTSKEVVKDISAFAHEASTSTHAQPRTAPAVLERAFDDAWAHWPKKVERKTSVERFIVAARKFDDITELVDLIKTFGEAYAATTGKQFIPALGVWLGRERWTDELPQQRTAETRVTAAQRNLTTVEHFARLEQQTLEIGQ